jgi:hypothetical protein
MKKRLFVAGLLAGACLMGNLTEASASSHREAPFVTKNPKVDSTDFYMFRSYEAGRQDYVTILANYLPLQDAYGGPNYFSLDPEARYDINIDNNADGVPDISFQFQFQNALNGANGLTLPITLEGTTKNNSVPLVNIGPITAADSSKQNVLESYTLNVVRGTASQQVGTTFKKPLDYVGTTTFANYDAYANSFVNNVALPGCSAGNIKVFVGQRAEGFAANIGVIFDLLQGGNAGFATAITGGSTAAGRGRNAANPADTGLLYGKNVTTIALEVPRACLVKDANSPIIGGWTTANLRQARVINPNGTYALPAKEGGAWTQVSRLGMPLVNEVVVGLKDKDLYSTLPVKDTGKIADYVTHPTLPAIIELLYGSFGAVAPKKVRTDLVAAFAQGLEVTLNDAGGTKVKFTQNTTTGVFEYLRLNTADALGATPTSKADQIAKANGLGALGCFTADRKVDLGAAACDLQGFPNGRRPGDDVLDIALRVVMGVLFANDADAPARNVPFTDVNFNGPEQFTDTFPYLNTPFPGNGGNK